MDRVPSASLQPAVPEAPRSPERGEPRRRDEHEALLVLLIVFLTLSAFLWFAWAGAWGIGMAMTLEPTTAERLYTLGIGLVTPALLMAAGVLLVKRWFVYSIAALTAAWGIALLAIPVVFG